jgi:hypothetical protein
MKGILSCLIGLGHSLEREELEGVWNGVFGVRIT